MEDTSICQYLKGLKRNIQKGKKKLKKLPQETREVGLKHEL
jgi:hypothetical protein